ncbi:aminoglycoside 6-adenylyltransferase [Vallitalea okinawensis]|uniref:aminoglycoside 6-adenylyltransferase n=1 Tax=Vallitalea okinawensis TaxID=2078660 RepID=UPI000CFB8EB7|nr:aminoglycoside 6-adenylyltransferase [Vallitalea okinawensis]
MNTLQHMLDKTVHLLKEDKRCLGGWHFGSISRGLQDKYSDIDPVFLIKDKDFESFDSHIQGMFDEMGYEILLFWPEEFNSNAIRNYAILIKDKRNILQYDFTIMNHSKIDEPFSRIWYKGCTKKDIIFDKDGDINKLLNRKQKDKNMEIDILHTIQKYWLLCFIIVKYYNRRDIFKLLYMMNELFQTHVQLLFRFYRPDEWGSWADQIKSSIPFEKQQNLLSYFCKADLESIMKNLLLSITAFEEDAKMICVRNQMPYEETLATKIKDYMVLNIGKSF